ncbi:glutamic acid-rich protein isoform X2 [Vigna radiata var. radiata]|uniref:Glutamic acid-rich protein isoform X2 n=1 Tax=Vigna radiata var. radiata TaxID=3916 RepID=A0A1S3TU32_VIGRR|nr:glutamic acid-rich protein isoform X2 [Vigna radiata var. radiata]
MGGKGKRRREKNYRAAHGGYSGLPPPPNPSQLDALPSKLRQIMSFSQRPDGANGSSKNQNNNDGHAQNTTSKDKSDVRTKDVKEGNTNEQLEELQHIDKSEEQLPESGAIDKKKKKRKRKEVKDLRFEMEVDKASSQLKRRERKKKYLEAKKKKHKKSHEEEMGFPGHEKIEFGDIVQAPPKLSVPPRAFKNASQERLRLQAIEEYRSRKGWTSRPGNHLPPPVTTLDS